MKTSFALSPLFLLAVLAGCANPGVRERTEAAENFRTNLVAETDAVLEPLDRTLTLSNAVDLARARTLKLTQQDLEAKLARVTRATAFSAFLPTLTFNAGTTRLNGGLYDTPYVGTRTSDDFRVDTRGMMVAQPVFTPVAWVMFAESRYGVRIKDIVRSRAGELLDAQVAALFCRAATADRTVRAYERQLESGRALTNRVTRLAAEGYALAADRVRAEARCAVDEASLRQAMAERESTRAALSDILRLWPLADYRLDGDSALDLPPLPEKPVEEWVWQALVTRKDLYAGDQTVELRKARVIEALAGFLPNVVLGGGGMNSSLENVVVRGWGASLVGTWAAFEGFRSVQQYRAARAEREAEFRLQEDRMLAVTVAVADAYRNLRVAHEAAVAARTWAKAAAMDHAATERRYADGQETFSTVLDKLAVRDEAEVKAVRARYLEALAGVQLRQAAGVGLFEREKGKVKSEK